MPITALERQIVETELKTSDVVSIVRKYGFTLRDVRDVQIAKLKLTVVGVDPDWGRAEIQQFAIARKPIDDQPWDLSDGKIERARKDYDAGLVEMATGRANTAAGPHLILYVFPRRKPIFREAYFSRDFSQG